MRDHISGTMNGLGACALSYGISGRSMELFSIGLILFLGQFVVGFYRRSPQDKAHE
jgi:hypothetical protein